LFLSLLGRLSAVLLRVFALVVLRLQQLLLPLDLQEVWSSHKRAVP
jgi:hypothetical protein